MAETYRVWQRPPGTPPGTLDGCAQLGTLTVPDRTPLQQVSELARRQHPGVPSTELVIEAVPSSDS